MAVISLLCGIGLAVLLVIWVDTSAQSPIQCWQQTTATTMVLIPCPSASPTPTPSPTGTFESQPNRIFFGSTPATPMTTGFGTTSPVFNDDGVTGAKVGQYFAIDGGASGASAYLGLGGTVPNFTDRVGALNFYNRAFASPDGRTAAIMSFGDGTLGTGRLAFYTSPSTVGPVERFTIYSDGSMTMGAPHARGGTLSVTALPNNSLIQTWNNVAATPVVSILNSGKVYVRSAGGAFVMKSPNGSCFEKSVDDGGNWLTKAVSPCPP